MPLPSVQIEGVGHRYGDVTFVDLRRVRRFYVAIGRRLTHSTETAATMHMNPEAKKAGR